MSLFEVPIEDNKHPNFEWRGREWSVDSFILWGYLIWVWCLNNFVANCSLKGLFNSNFSAFHWVHGHYKRPSIFILLRLFISLDQFLNTITRALNFHCGLKMSGNLRSIKYQTKKKYKHKRKLTSLIKTLKSKLAFLWNANEQGRALRKTLNSSGDSSENKINKNNNSLFTSIKGIGNLWSRLILRAIWKEETWLQFFNAYIWGLGST